jgi:hypothetical protein
MVVMLALWAINALIYATLALATGHRVFWAMGAFSAVTFTALAAFGTRNVTDR